MLTPMVMKGKAVVFAIFLLALGLSAQLGFAVRQDSAATPAPDLAQHQEAPPKSDKPTVTPIPVKKARDAAWNLLKEGLAQKDAEKRAAATSALGDIGLRTDVVGFAERGLEDKDYRVRQAAVDTLGSLKSRTSIAKLRVALDDDSPVVSFAAAQALWAMDDRSGASIFIQVLEGDRKAAPGLIQQQWHDMKHKLHNPGELAAFGASQAAGAFLGPGAFGVTAVEELMKDKTAGVRALSAQLLGSSMGPAAREELRSALGDKSWVVRARAAEGLGHNGTRQDVENLLPLLDDGHAAVKYKSAAAIVRLASPRTAGTAPRGRS
jgi:HEAT repeat protein